MELKPETEQLVREEISSGRFRSVDEMIVQGVRAQREKHGTGSPSMSQGPRKRLYDLLTQPPFAGSGLKLERQKDAPRPIDL